ncbi:VOC family protein [Methylocystis sp. H62]|uniref:VOC family protein n=1 Tax=Methylocystis sp. H62 TaxID=2785789 RepID=UPI0018C2D807|nr:VOC family protein [Methylocystis sp. H62]MBG0792881.1 VOC family protein [Methylocystis sp. H62]
MSIILNHTIVPSRNKKEAAAWFAQVFGLSFEDAAGHFAPVRLNETLTFSFADEASFERHHYAFHVSETEFDAILHRVKERGLAFGSAPWSQGDSKLNDWNGGRGVYFENVDGHLLELMTVAQ